MVLKFGAFALITLSVLTGGCSSPGERLSSIERKHYGEHEAAIGYTQAVRKGNNLYLAGLTSEGETVADQLAGIYDTIEQILSDYGATTSDILTETIYTTDIEALKESIPVRKSYYPDNLYPAATWVQVEGLFLPNFKVEVEVMVQLPRWK